MNPSAFRFLTTRFVPVAATASLLTCFGGGIGQAATAPANDAFASATGAHPASVLSTGVSVVATTTGATYESGEHSAYQAAAHQTPAYDCWGGASVWYAIPSGTTHLAVDVTAATSDTALTLWSASTASPAVSAVSGRGAIRVADGDLGARLDQDLDPTLHWFLAADACNASSAAKPLPSSVTGSVTFTPTLTSAPPNDAFASHTPIGGPSGSATGDTTGAQQDDSEQCPASGVDPVGKGVWFRWTAPSTGSFVFDTHGSAFNTLLCAAPASSSVGQFDPTVSNDDVSADDQTSAIKVVAQAGSQWDVLVEGADDGTDKAAGVYQLSWHPVPDTTAPTLAIASPAPGGSVPTGSTLPVTVDAADAESGIDHVTVTLAGSAPAVTSTGSNGIYTTAFDLKGRAPGAYTLTATATDHAGNTSAPVTESVVVTADSGKGNGVTVTIPSGYTGAGSVNLTTSNAITKRGFTATKGSKGHALASSQRNATVVLHFVGTGIDLHFDATKAGGKAIVTLDGKKKVIDLYSRHAHDFLTSLKHLAQGTHVVSVTVLGQKQAASSGFRVVLSLLRVYA